MMKKTQIEKLLEEKENLSFIEKNLKEDSTKLLLKYSNDLDKRLLIEQIAQKQRVRKKLPSYYHNPNLILAPSLNLAQSSSEETAQLKSEWIGRGDRMTDLTAGFGIDCSHFASNFKHCQFVEPNEELLQIVQHNFRSQDLYNTSFHGIRAETFLKKLEKQDFIYLDPSRRNEHAHSIIKVEDYQPNILELLPELLGKSDKLLVKLSPMISISNYLAHLPGVSEIWVISQRNDCKEVCFYWEHNYKADLKIRTANITEYDLEYFESHYSDNKKVEIASLDSYLYLPNASILKAGIQDNLAFDWQLRKLDTHTHIYTSNVHRKDYPGRVFKVLRTTKSYDKSFAKGSYNIVSKNFPDKADYIAKKLKINKSHKSRYLIACQHKSELIFIEAELLLY